MGGSIQDRGTGPLRVGLFAMFTDVHPEILGYLLDAEGHAALPDGQGSDRSSQTRSVRCQSVRLHRPAAGWRRFFLNIRSCPPKQVAFLKKRLVIRRNQGIFRR